MSNKNIEMPKDWKVYAPPKGMSSQAKFMRHPCTVFLSDAEQKAIRELDPEVAQDEGHYFIESRQKSTVIAFMVRTCPDGFHKNVKKQMCVPLEGQSLKTICYHKNTLTGKSPVSMLKEHLKNVQQTSETDNI